MAMADNIHTARWINQLYGSGHELHLFPSIPNRPLHPLLRGKVIYHPYPRLPFFPPSPLSSISNTFSDYTNRLLLHLKSPDSHAKSLIKLIGQIGPIDQILIHSLEFQSAGYLTLEVKHSMKDNFPKWLATNWGSDIYYFGKIKEHKNKIKQLLNECNYYSCECQRDIDLAHDFGFKGKAFLSTTNTGGYDLQWVNTNQVKELAKRKTIMLKGYQGWSGRVLTALEALEKVGNLLNGYELAIYSINPPNNEIVSRAHALAKSHKMRLTIVPLNTGHDEILKLHGKARISIGLSISDALSTSAVEAMVMGSFPIQSDTACLGLFLENGINGFLVPPENGDAVAHKIKEALTNDSLINKAYEYNQLCVAPKFAYEKIKKETMKMYSDIFTDV